MTTIPLSHTIVLRPEVTTQEVSILRYTDNPVAKQVIATLQMGLPEWIRELILWEGQDYDTIGQWTDTQAEARIKQLLEA